MKFLLCLATLVVVSLGVCSGDSVFMKMGTYCEHVGGHTREKTYYVAKNMKGTWLDAFNYCRSFKLDLVTFGSLDELRKVEEMKSTHADYFTFMTYVGGMTNTLQSRNDWFWVHSGDKIPFDIPWISGEPNNIDKEEWCLSIGPTASEAQFNDIMCNAEHRFTFICQRVDSLSVGCA